MSSKVSKAAKQFENYNKIRKHHSTDPNIEGGLYSQMMGKGLIPAKGEDFDLEDSFFWDMEGFTEYRAAPGKQNAKLITQPGDRELFFRHEMHNSGYANLTKKEGVGTVPRVTDETNGGGTPMFWSQITACLSTCSKDLSNMECFTRLSNGSLITPTTR